MNWTKANNKDKTFTDASHIAYLFNNAFEDYVFDKQLDNKILKKLDKSAIEFTIGRKKKRSN